MRKTTNKALQPAGFAGGRALGLRRRSSALMNSRSDAGAQPVQCCFCGDMITGEPPLAIELRMPQDVHQSLFAHGKCFRCKLHASVPFLTPAEWEEDT